MTKDRIIEILQQILQVEDLEVIHISIESLIEKLSEDLNDKESDIDNNS